jgi:hypothetical protein
MKKYIKREHQMKHNSLISQLIIAFLAALLITII